MEKNKIYLPLQGRIGNQLFQYAFARKLQLELPNNPTIIMDDSDIIRCNWENSLMYYDLPNVEYIHESILEKRFVLSKQYFLRKLYRILTRNKNYMDKFRMECRLNSFFNRKGLFFCENGYMELPTLCSTFTLIQTLFRSRNFSIPGYLLYSGNCPPSNKVIKSSLIQSKYFCDWKYPSM